jgi:hypothetical protein
MAKQPPKEEFLGGFTFNEAGARPAEPDPAADDTGPIRIPSRLTPANLRTLITVGIVLLLIVVLYIVTDSRSANVKTNNHPNNTGSGQMGPSAPPKNF